MKKLPNFVKWLIIAVVLAAMAAMMVAVNDRASRVEMPMPDNSLGIYRTDACHWKVNQKNETGLLRKRPRFLHDAAASRICCTDKSEWVGGKGMFVVTLSKASVKKLGVGAMCCALVVFSAMLGRYISTRSVAVAAAGQ